MSQHSNIDNIAFLHDEAGNEIALEFLDLIEYKDTTYAAFLPVDNGGDDLIILKYEENNGSISFDSVESPLIIEVVFNIFKERYKDRFIFT